MSRHGWVSAGSSGLILIHYGDAILFLLAVVIGEVDAVRVNAVFRGGERPGAAAADEQDLAVQALQHHPRIERRGAPLGLDRHAVVRYTLNEQVRRTAPYVLVVRVPAVPFDHEQPASQLHAVLPVESTRLGLVRSFFFLRHHWTRRAGLPVSSSRSNTRIVYGDAC
jgi:hypothetical protein